MTWRTIRINNGGNVLVECDFFRKLEIGFTVLQTRRKEQDRKEKSRAVFHSIKQPMGVVPFWLTGFPLRKAVSTPSK